MSESGNNNGEKLNVNHENVFKCFCGLLEDVRYCICEAKQQLQHGVSMVKFCKLVNDPDLMNFVMYSTFYSLPNSDNREKMLAILRRTLDDIESIHNSLLVYHDFIDKYFVAEPELPEAPELPEIGGAIIVKSATDVA